MILETARLRLRKLTPDDAEFILGLLNEPSFRRYIGDKGVRNLADARDYILNVPMDSYERHGFGLYLVELKATALAIGICGLVQRPALPAADIGFAFLPAYWAQGYAVESAQAVLDYARTVLGLRRILGITTPDNQSSIKVLQKIGLRFERLLRLTAEEPAVKLFASTT
ncbi:MAG: GNAT family N-acetyltransferase [Acidobacteria bacterium]|nr:GNAT family N-acetyltransferase [Acidobacteriota bacterium]